MKREADILIIGGGAIGICAAYYLTERGRSVTLVEKGDICSGSSYGNAGLIVPSHSVPLAEPGVVAKGLRWLLNPEGPFYIKPRLNAEMISWLWRFWRHCTSRHVKKASPVIRDLSLASAQLFEDLAAIEGLDFDFEKKGALYAYRTQDGLKSATAEVQHLQDLGIQASVLTPEEMQPLNPELQMQVEGGIFYPQDCHLDPARFVRQLAQHLTQKGALILPDTEVLALETSSDRITAVRTTRGDFVAEQIILAGGSWSPEIVRSLGMKLPIQPAKGYSITVKRPNLSPTVPTMLSESKVAVTPIGDLLRFAGTLELAGLDLSVNMRRVKAILRAVPLYLPQIDPDSLDLIEIWRGPRPCTPDGLPFLGRTHKNLIVAAGHAMIGITLAPISGKLIAQIVTEEKPDIDLSPLRVERFT